MKVPLSKKIGAYLLTLSVTYWVAWTLAFLFINGPDFAYYVSYWIYAVQGGGERAVFTLGYSIVFFLPLSLVSAFVVHRRFKKADEKKA